MTIAALRIVMIAATCLAVGLSAAVAETRADCVIGDWRGEAEPFAAVVTGPGTVPVAPPDQRRARTARPALAMTPFIVSGREQPGCPSSEARCASVDTMASIGARVLVGRSWNGFACVLDGMGEQTRIGWLPDARISAIVTTAAPPLRDWTGDWRPIIGEADIIIGQARDAPEVRVQALVTVGLQRGGRYYRGNDQIDDGGLPVGDRLRVKATPDVTYVTTEDSTILTLDNTASCDVDLRLVGDYLLVSHPGPCGARAGRFSGVYVR